MASTLRSVLIGTKQSAYQRYLILALTLGVFATTLAAYALGIVSVSGGVMWIPFHAAIVGMLAGLWIGYSQSGLLFAWLVTYTSLLGYHAERAFFGLSGRKFSEQLTYFVRLDGLVFLAVEGIVLGTVSFFVGFLLRWGIDSFRNNSVHIPSGNGN